MIKVENLEAFNFEGAVRGARNPMNSWSKSDSEWFIDDALEIREYVVGHNDLDLMQRLYKAGPEHAKYLRQIPVSVDIVAPLYWWKEFDTYKVGTTANSCSTMHKLMAKPFESADFSFEDLMEVDAGSVAFVVAKLNELRIRWNNEKDSNIKKKIWRAIVQLLPEGYEQRRTITMNYANTMNIINQRSNHKLDEWHEFVRELRTLPYVNEIRGEK